MPSRETSAEIDDAAALWAARADRGSLSGLEAEELAAWLAGDKRRAGAFARAQALLIPCDEVAALGEAVRRGGVSERSGLSRRNVLAMTGVAAAATIAVAGYWKFGRPNVYETAHGEMRRIPLSDGSVVTLNTASRIDVSMRDHRRYIRLLEGETYFEVASDEAHPLTVDLAGATVRAWRTAFAVRKIGAAPLQVIVHEGAVQLSGAFGNSLQLDASTKAVLDVHGNAKPVTEHIGNEELIGDLAWREGKIALTGQTLKEAAAEFNRYNTVQIITDGRAGRRSVVGWFSASDPAGFARAIAASMDLQVRISAETIIVSDARTVGI